MEAGYTHWENRFCNELPSDSEALALFKESWNTTIPGAEIQTGRLELFDDPRIHWLFSQLDLNGKNVLELGSLDGAHSYMFEKIGGASVTGIEGNVSSFIKSLIIKNIFDLRAKFFLGDFLKYIQYSSMNYYLISLCGVLYHQLNPELLLAECCKHAKNLFIWSHFYDPEITFDGLDKECTFRKFLGIEIRLHKFIYPVPTVQDEKFCGGFNPHAFWLERQSLLDILNLFGFKINIAYEKKHHAFPDILLLASKDN